eukprot:scaffold41083_cov191-Amphora_coffeaeformis.AAC.7
MTSSYSTTPTVQEVETWFRQAATGQSAAALQTWVTAVTTVAADATGSTSTQTAAFDILLQLLLGSSRQHNTNNIDDISIRFYALTTLDQLLHCWTSHQRALLTRTLVYDLPATHTKNIPSFWRNKVAAVLMTLFLRQIANTDGRHSMTDDLAHLAQTQPALYLKVLQALLEAIVVDNYHQQEAMAFKTWFKQPQFNSNSNRSIASSSSNGVGRHQECFVTTVGILQQTLHNSSSQEDTGVLMVLALETMQAFLAWTDVIALTDSPGVVWQVLWQTLQQQPSSPEVQMAVLQVWQEWTTSTTATASNSDSSEAQAVAMVQHAKVPIMTTVLQQIHSLNLLPYQGESEADIEVVIAVAKLVNAFGLEIVSWWVQATTTTATSAEEEQEIRPAVVQLFGQVLDLFFRAFAYDDIDVSAAVLLLASRLVNTEQAAEHVPHMLNVLYRQMRYPVDFSYDFTDDINAEEEMYRAELDKLYIRIVKVAPALVLQFLQEAVANLTITTHHNGISAASTPDVEATLRLVYHYCEGIRPTPGVKTVLQNESFCSLLITLQQQGNLVHPQQHREVLRLYYETAVRYSLFYTKESQPHAEALLGNLLSALTGNCGLQHEHAQVRSRCCYLLLRLVKALIKLLRPLVQSAVGGICRLLSNSALSLRPDDTLYLFETIGLLLGKTGLPAHDQKAYLAQVMTPHIQSIEQVLSVPDLLQDTETYGESLSRSIAAVTCLSKGFSRHPPEPVQIVLLETIHITLRVLEALPMNEAVRSKSMTFLQRMIQCVLNAQVLAMVPRYLAVLIPYCTSDDCTFVAQIFFQVCIKFESGAAASALDSSLLPFFQKCQSLVSHAGDAVSSGHTDVPPHLQTEQLGIQKLVFGVLEHIVSHQVTGILISSTNAGSLESILRVTAEGAVHVMEASVRKTCLRVFRELTDQWIVQKQASDVYQRGLLAILYHTVIPGVLVAFGNDEFDERDAQLFRAVSEYSKLVFSLHIGGECENLLRSLYTAAVPSGSLDSLRAATEAKAVETLLMGRLAEWKKRGNL